MAFWDALFAPRCAACGDRIKNEDPVDVDRRLFHAECHAEIEQARAARAAEIAEQRRQEAEALARIEERQRVLTPRSITPAPRRDRE